MRSKCLLTRSRAKVTPSPELCPVNQAALNPTAMFSQPYFLLKMKLRCGCKNFCKEKVYIALSNNCVFSFVRYPLCASPSIHYWTPLNSEQVCNIRQATGPVLNHPEVIRFIQVSKDRQGFQLPP